MRSSVEVDTYSQIYYVQNSLPRFASVAADDLHKVRYLMHVHRPDTNAMWYGKAHSACYRDEKLPDKLRYHHRGVVIKRYRPSTSFHLSSLFLSLFLKPSRLLGSIDHNPYVYLIEMTGPDDNMVIAVPCWYFASPSHAGGHRNHRYHNQT